jgi:hypothetical protein
MKDSSESEGKGTYTASVLSELNTVLKNLGLDVIMRGQPTIPKILVREFRLLNRYSFTKSRGLIWPGAPAGKSSSPKAAV